MLLERFLSIKNSIPHIFEGRISLYSTLTQPLEHWFPAPCLYGVIVRFYIYHLGRTIP